MSKVATAPQGCLKKVKNEGKHRDLKNVPFSYLVDIYDKNNLTVRRDLELEFELNDK